jgi:hypothetical protein
MGSSTQAVPVMIASPQATAAAALRAATAKNDETRFVCSSACRWLLVSREAAVKTSVKAATGLRMRNENGFPDRRPCRRDLSALGAQDPVAALCAFSYGAGRQDPRLPDASPGL